MPKYPRDGEYVFQVENASGSQLLDAPGSGMYDAPITAIWDLQTDFRELAPKPPKATNRYLVPATQSERKKRKDKPWDENLAGFGRYRAGMAGAKDAGVHYDSARPKAYMSVERLPLSPRKMQGRFRQSYVPGSALGGLQALQKKMEASGSEVELVVSASMSSSSASSSTSFFSSSEYDSGNLWTLDSKFGPSPALSTLTRPLSPLKMDPSADGPSVYDNTFGEAGTLQLNLEPSSSSSYSANVRARSPTFLESISGTVFDYGSTDEFDMLSVAMSSLPPGTRNTEGASLASNPPFEDFHERRGHAEQHICENVP